MQFSQVITLFITLVIYLYLDHLSDRGPLKLAGDEAKKVPKQIVLASRDGK